MAHILVIDDEQGSRQLLRRMLETVGHEVEEALDGDDGLRQYRVRPADVVVMDILMPGADGLTAINEILREFPDAKIVAISGGGGNRNLDLLPKARDLGARYTFDKPFDVPAMLEAIDSLLDE